MRANGYSLSPSFDLAYVRADCPSISTKMATIDLTLYDTISRRTKDSDPVRDSSDKSGGCLVMSNGKAFSENVVRIALGYIQCFTAAGRSPLVVAYPASNI